MPTSILIFGNDRTLLDARSMVLEREGMWVQTASGLVEAMQMLLCMPIDVLILCQTLSKHERERMLMMVEAIQPPVEVLLLDAGGSLGLKREGTTVLRELAVPEALIAAVQRMTAYRGQSDF